MPIVANEAARRDARRAHLKSLKRGDFITCDGGVAFVAQSSSSPRELDRPESWVARSLRLAVAAEHARRAEAERKARLDREWLSKCRRWSW